MSAALPPNSLCVQVVLYDNDVAPLLRLAGAVGAAVRSARASHGLQRVIWKLGDCSRWPTLPSEAEQQLRAAAADANGVTGLDDVNITFFDANLGSAGGSNALALGEDTSLIWVLNPDTYPAPDSLSRLLDAIGSDDRIAIAESRQLPIEHQKSFDRETGDTSWSSGATMLVRREVFDAVGGFDDQFFPLYCDDVDLSWRVRLTGARVVHVPRSVVFHDKTIDADGGVRWSPTEARSSLLASLWLYRRYHRPDLEHELLERLAASNDAVAVDVLDEFRRRVEAGDAPEPLVDATTVATFVDGQLAPRRFSYVG